MSDCPICFDSECRGDCDRFSTKLDAALVQVATNQLDKYGIDITEENDASEDWQ